MSAPPTVIRMMMQVEDADRYDVNYPAISNGY